MLVQTSAQALAAYGKAQDANKHAAHASAQNSQQQKVANSPKVRFEGYSQSHLGPNLRISFYQVSAMDRADHPIGQNIDKHI